MAVYLTCFISIGDYEFTRTSGVEIKSCWKEIGDTATIQMFGMSKVEGPDSTKMGSPKRLDEVIKVGDPVVSRPAIAMQVKRIIRLALYRLSNSEKKLSVFAGGEKEWF